MKRKMVSLNVACGQESNLYIGLEIYSVHGDSYVSLIHFKYAINFFSTATFYVKQTILFKIEQGIKNNIYLSQKNKKKNCNSSFSRN